MEHSESLRHVEKRTILRGLIGSTAHGLSLPETDDRDEMGVCVEDFREAFGIGSPFEQFEHRTARERTGKHDAPSEKGDLDLVIYSLRKYVHLALKGNPTILNLLFVPDNTLVICTKTGTELRAMKGDIISRHAGKRFLGYMQAQKERLTGVRGQMRVKRPELVAQHGFDTKYAHHVLRLGLQGIELLTSGTITLPMREADQTYLLAVRRGEIPFGRICYECELFEKEIKSLLDKSPLPEEPNYDKVETWMLDTYMEAWTLQNCLTRPACWHRG